MNFYQVSLGIVDENEAKTEGMLNIMRYQHQYVAGQGTDSLNRMFTVGDLMTVER